MPKQKTKKAVRKRMKLTKTGKNRLNDEQINALLDATREVAAGKLDGEFPIDVFQTGSGTSSNMNANEVIARLASQFAGVPVHPNDHVNMGQSSNDVIPTAIHVSAALSIERHLLPALAHLSTAIERRSPGSPARSRAMLERWRTTIWWSTPARRMDSTRVRICLLSSSTSTFRSSST